MIPLQLRWLADEGMRPPVTQFTAVTKCYRRAMLLAAVFLHMRRLPLCSNLYSLAPAMGAITVFH